VKEGVTFILLPLLAGNNGYETHGHILIGMPFSVLLPFLLISLFDHFSKKSLFLKVVSDSHD